MRGFSNSQRLIFRLIWKNIVPKNQLPILSVKFKMAAKIRVSGHIMRNYWQILKIPTACAQVWQQYVIKNISPKSLLPVWSEHFKFLQGKGFFGITRDLMDRFSNFEWHISLTTDCYENISSENIISVQSEKIKMATKTGQNIGSKNLLQV